MKLALAVAAAAALTVIATSAAAVAEKHPDPTYSADQVCEAAHKLHKLKRYTLVVYTHEGRAVCYFGKKHLKVFILPALSEKQLRTWRSNNPDLDREGTVQRMGDKTILYLSLYQGGKKATIKIARGIGLEPKK